MPKAKIDIEFKAWPTPHFINGTDSGISIPLKGAPPKLVKQMLRLFSDEVWEKQCAPRATPSDPTVKNP
jgi:hypothetical protein